MATPERVEGVPEIWSSCAVQTDRFFRKTHLCNVPQVEDDVQQFEGIIQPITGTEAVVTVQPVFNVFTAESGENLWVPLPGLIVRAGVGAKERALFIARVVLSACMT